MYKYIYVSMYVHIYIYIGLYMYVVRCSGLDHVLTQWIAGHSATFLKVTSENYGYDFEIRRPWYIK